ncbi:MAG: hypothetical protein WCK89_16525 [bacterium]
MKRLTLFACLAVGAAGLAASAADPETAWRETVRAYMASNGVNRAGVTNVLAGAVLPGCSGANVTNLSGANLASGNIPLARLTNALAPVLVTGTVTGVVSQGGASTSNWVFVNGVLTGR